MTVYSLYLSTSLACYDNDVDDADYAEMGTRFVHGQRYNILYRKIQDIALDAADSYVLNFANYSVSYPNDWLYLVAEVVGNVRLDTVGKDYNNIADIAGHTPSFGTAMYPGKLLISTYNVTTATLVGLADNTKIKLLAAIACPDNDARYIENL